MVRLAKARLSSPGGFSWREAATLQPERVNLGSESSLGVCFHAGLCSPWHCRAAPVPATALRADRAAEDALIPVEGGYGPDRYFSLFIQGSEKQGGLLLSCSVTCLPLRAQESS